MEAIQEPVIIPLHQVVMVIITMSTVEVVSQAHNQIIIPTLLMDPIQEILVAIQMEAMLAI